MCSVLGYAEALKSSNDFETLLKAQSQPQSLVDKAQKESESKKSSDQAQRKYLPESASISSVSLGALADHNLNMWWQQSDLKESSVGQAVDQVEKSLSQEIAIRKNNQVEHNVKIGVLAMQATTSIRYEGWTKAEVQYNFRDRSSSFEIKESLGHKDLVVGHYESSAQSLSQVAVRWPW